MKDKVTGKYGPIKELSHYTIDLKTGEVEYRYQKIEGFHFDGGVKPTYKKNTIPRIPSLIEILMKIRSKRRGDP